jgi:site-specific recombinase XerD
LLQAFAEHLTRHRGSSAATLKNRTNRAAAFLSFLRDRKHSIQNLQVSDIDAFVIDCRKRYARTTVAAICSSLRSFLRFLHATGRLAVNLAPAVMAPMVRRGERPQRTLPWEDVRRILHAVDRSVPGGQRDYTLLSLMSVYGLGAGEVIRLRLDDIDWHAATLRVTRPKAGVEFWLPLLPAVARALVTYLRHGRPMHVATRYLFLTPKAPHRTGYGGVPESVRALRLGAYDFLEKPCDPQRLGVILNGARRSARARRRLRDLREAGSRKYLPEAFVGRSGAARQVRQLLGRLAEVPFSALIISGETGTGKGLVARILHRSGSRADGPMIEVNCAALPRDLLESELFGHEAGAFTGAKGCHCGYLEQADGGTLFLDEIGEMDLDLQSKLLTAIEDRVVRRLGGESLVKIDVQVVAASNRDLERQVREGPFAATSTTA